MSRHLDSLRRHHRSRISALTQEQLARKLPIGPNTGSPLRRLIGQARRVCALKRGEPSDMACFLGDGRDLVYAERGFFCLGLAFVSKYPLHIAIMEWLFFIAASVYIGLGIAIAIAKRTES
jgi:hypothetical protein